MPEQSSRHVQRCRWAIVVRHVRSSHLGPVANQILGLIWPAAHAFVPGRWPLSADPMRHCVHAGNAAVPPRGALHGQPAASDDGRPPSESRRVRSCHADHAARSSCSSSSLILFALLIWGRWRYDLVAFAALVAALVAGVVPADQAFCRLRPSGDRRHRPGPGGEPRPLELRRGRVPGRQGDRRRRGRLYAHIGIMSGLAAVLSAVMNNVAALALLMPVDLEAAPRPSAARP